ncbi:MAG TPA: carboxypeptidase-like regulatory domain-containing protein [Kineosporiaceae bacterium]|nr:carboxypeptidase-like regulatory domain-containing protein [Kineosporiaceae bacterium]
MLAVLAVLTAAALPARAAETPSEAARTMPHLKFVCPAAIGDHRFAGILPDGPRQEQCFYEDAKGSNFAVGASWVTETNRPGDSNAVCPAEERTAWHQGDSTGLHLERSSSERRAHGYIFLNLYWPNPEKLARQTALLPQSEALGDRMLAAAEKLAQPCVEATPTQTADPTDSAQPTVPDDSTSPTTSPEPSGSATETADRPLCTAIEGRLTDNGGHPVANLAVRLYVRGSPPADTATDAEGTFRFTDLPDTPQSRADDGAQLRVTVQDTTGLWRLYAGEDLAMLDTEPFALTRSQGCRHDLTTSSLAGFTSANPSSSQKWAALWSIVSTTRYALGYLRSALGVSLKNVPFEIHAWCPPSLSSTCTATKEGAFTDERRPTEADLRAGVGVSGHVPYVALTALRSDKQASRVPGDCIYHELGHLLQLDLAGGMGRMHARGQDNHAGYKNPSSNDSWMEGFANWFAITVRQTQGRWKPYYEWTSGGRRDTEKDTRAWDANGKDEEWAVAGLLTDLVDRGSGTAEQGQPLQFSITGQGAKRLIRGTAGQAVPADHTVVVELYDGTGKRIASDDAHVLPDGLFFDVPLRRFAEVKVFLRPASSGTGRQDDDPFALSPRRVLELITSPPDIGTRGGRTKHSSVVFDVAELHSVLRANLPAKDVDALFVAHGFHENLRNENTYVKGAAIGRTTHPPFDPRTRPRYDPEITPARWVTVNTQGRQATVIVFPEDGTPYATTPDAAGRVPVMVPGSLDSRVGVLTLAAGSQPAVDVIESATFWPEAARHDGAFLTLQPTLEPLAATTHGGGHRWDRLPVIGAGAALIAFAAGTALIGALHRRRRRNATGPMGAGPGTQG